MRPSLKASWALFAFALLAGCAASPAPKAFRIGDLPADWDEEAPDRSELAKEPYYVLAESSSFLVKGASYARYILRIDHTYEGPSIFFTSTNSNTPNVKHPDPNSAEYHYEFMQLRSLGKTIRVMDVNAGTAFKNASTGHTMTLAFIYGRGANYQYLVPYEGNPGNWTLNPGYYELVIATDEDLTVGVNVKVGTPLWTTYYHPQELGESHAAALENYVRLWPGATPSHLQEQFNRSVKAGPGENLNYWIFSNLIYRSNLAAVGAHGTVTVQVDDREVPHRLDATGLTPTSSQRSEAFAYAVSFNEKGPAEHQLRTQLEFTETTSLQSDLLAQMLVFGIVLHPLQSLAAIPPGGP